MKPQDKPALRRSATHQKLMPDQLLLEAFGKLNPSTSERTMYFFDVWCESKQHSYKLEAPIRPDMIKIRVQDICNKLGFLPLWDYQIKGTEVRFKQQEDLAMFIISWKDNG